MTFRVKGAAAVRRFLLDYERTTRERIITQFMRLYPLDQLRNRVPRGPTGRLRRSLKLVRVGDSVELHGIFYGRFEPNRSLIEAEAMKLANSTMARVRATI